MIYVLKDLPQRRATRFSLEAQPREMGTLAADFQLLALRKLRFEGHLTPISGSDWLLEAKLGATVVQPCRVTLAPVTTRIEEKITRRYLADLVDPDETESEMPEDDTAEPLPTSLDLNRVMAEALALAIPAFPRNDATDQSVTQATPPGAAPLDDDAVKPFAGLAALKAQMVDESQDESDP